MKKEKLIIDCGPGRDQEIGLIYLAARRESFDTAAVITGSTDGKVKDVTRRVLGLLHFLGLSVPVAAGSGVPLVREPLEMEIPGPSSLEGSLEEAQKEQGVLFLHRVLNELPGGEKATIAALSTLTNLALLLRLFPEDAMRIREIVFSCGACMTASAESHLYADPEAAGIVFQSGIPLVICGREAGSRCTLTRNQILKLCQSKSPFARLAGDLAGFSLENTSDRYRGETGIYGAVPFVYLLHPGLFTGERTLADVDCSWGKGRGTALCDLRWWEHEPEDMNASVLLGADAAGFQEELITAFYELGDENPG